MVNFTTSTWSSQKLPSAGGSILKPTLFYLKVLALKMYKKTMDNISRCRNEHLK
jgi:hypothetical protein